MSDRRNPYLILGLPYGAGRAEATKALAKRSRQARRDGAFPYELEDLTWALNQVEMQIEDPVSGLDTFRVPADHEVFDLPPGPGLLRPAPQALPRRSPASTTADRQVIVDLACDDAFAELAQRMTESVAPLLAPRQPVKTVIRPSTPPKRRRF
ncbi:hypothetical protein [Gemmatimonas sp.]|uniref:hypothetical protein n=1 Tax=Gemmatimonas sp. TaxID=1962908 RepID=UPI0035681662